jgi:microcystin-dependent protein
LTNITLGEVSGTETVTLLTTQMPAHTHTASSSLAVNQNAATTNNPAGKVLAAGVDATANPIPTYADAGSGQNLGGLSTTIGISGNSQPVPIVNPYLGLNYIICLFGIFPSRN